ncbi:MAG: hypothetical protein A2Y79_06525 [Deltaproteobacteria bacterium RBG_13_43_22]|nr:MAG: hypothetical protein A2Y79_06525 [Deltaproteobacteria bacterium RBG_13_43_22]
MVSFNIMELGNPITALGKSGSGSLSQPARPEDQTSDFSQELSLKFNNGNQVSVEQQENLSSSKEVKKESSQEKTLMNTDQPNKEAVACTDLSITVTVAQLGKPAQPVQDEKKEEWLQVQENPPGLFSDPPLLIDSSEDSQLALKRSLEEETGPDNGLTVNRFFTSGETVISNTVQIPLEEPVVLAERTGEGRPDLLGFHPSEFTGEPVLKGTLEEETGPGWGLKDGQFLLQKEKVVSSTVQIPLEEPVVLAERTGDGRPDLLGFRPSEFTGEPVLKGTPEEETGPDNGLIVNRFFPSGETVNSKTVQIPIDNFFVKKVEPLGKKLPGVEYKEQGSNRNMEKNGKGVDAFFEFQTEPNSRSSWVKAVETADRGGGEKGSDQPKGTGPLYQSDGYLNDLKNSIPVKGKEGLILGFNQEDAKNNPSIQNRAELENKGAVYPQNIEIAGAIKDFLNTGNLFAEKLNVLGTLNKPLGMTLSPGQTFIIRKHSPSSMEISIEPDGLGKLDIELNLIQDRIHGQITVRDSQGRDLIENNLPQLLSEMVKEGLQVGEFSVSLKNQGRDQNPLPDPSEVRKQPRTILSSENVFIRNDHHLIHIII